MSNYFKDIIASREIFYFLIWREIRARYKQAVLGFFWAILQPILLMTLFSIVGNLLKLSSEGLPRAVFYYSAALPWTFFSVGTNQAANSLVSNANLVKQVYFPRELFPWSSIATALFDFAVSFIVFIAMLLFYHIQLTWNILYLPMLVLIQILFIMPVALIFSGLNVAFRDIRFIVTFLLQIWLYASPIVYSIDAIPEHFQSLYMLNPMAGLIDSYRLVLAHGQPPNWQGLWIGIAVSVVLCLVSYIGFKKAERIFADII